MHFHNVTLIVPLPLTYNKYLLLISYDQVSVFVNLTTGHEILNNEMHPNCHDHYDDHDDGDEGYNNNNNRYNSIYLIINDNILIDYIFISNNLSSLSLCLAADRSS
jgi:hypothetical protein